MGYVDLVRCVLVLRCGLAVVVWYPYPKVQIWLGGEAVLGLGCLVAGLSWWRAKFESKAVNV